MQVHFCFTQHGAKRLKKRSSMDTRELISLLEVGLFLRVGPDYLTSGGEKSPQGLYFLVWSLKDRGPVIVVGKSTVHGDLERVTIITVLSRRSGTLRSFQKLLANHDTLEIARLARYTFRKEARTSRKYDFKIRPQKQEQEVNLTVYGLLFPRPRMVDSGLFSEPLDLPEFSHRPGHPLTFRQLRDLAESLSGFSAEDRFLLWIEAETVRGGGRYVLYRRCSKKDASRTPRRDRAMEILQHGIMTQSRAFKRWSKRVEYPVMVREPDTVRDREACLFLGWSQEHKPSDRLRNATRSHLEKSDPLTWEPKTW